MASLLGSFTGAVFGGTLFVSLFEWILRKISGAEVSSDPTLRTFAAFLIVCGLATWGFWGDQAPIIYPISSFVGYAIGALIVRALLLKRRAQKELSDTFE